MAGRKLRSSPQASLAECCKGSKVGQRRFEAGMGEDCGGDMGFWSRLDGFLSPWAPSGVYVTALVSL